MVSPLFLPFIGYNINHVYDKIQSTLKPVFLAHYDIAGPAESREAYYSTVDDFEEGLVKGGDFIKREIVSLNIIEAGNPQGNLCLPFLFR